MREQYDDIIIAGDLNLPDINWHNTYDEANLTQINTHATRGKKFLTCSLQANRSS
jgi:hypothetical protein